MRNSQRSCEEPFLFRKTIFCTSRLIYWSNRSKHTSLDCIDLCCQVPHCRGALGLYGQSSSLKGSFWVDLDPFVFFLSIRAKCALGLLGWPHLVPASGGSVVELLGCALYKSWIILHLQGVLLSGVRPICFSFNFFSNYHFYFRNLLFFFFFFFFTGCIFIQRNRF